MQSRQLDRCFDGAEEEVVIGIEGLIQCLLHGSLTHIISYGLVVIFNVSELFQQSVVLQSDPGTSYSLTHSMPDVSGGISRRRVAPRILLTWLLEVVVAWQ